MEPCTEGARGLSPRVRGNLRADQRPAVGRRSIPACTGEPSLPTELATDLAVYPRVYGGTPNSSFVMAYALGLSPRVRGNRGQRMDGGAGIRSIPACTGEPCGRNPGSGIGQVYPRVYGGTFMGAVDKANEHGLSPRVRGNPASRRFILASCGSIPACTGEPPVTPARRIWRTVYPRVYGGTPCLPRRRLDADGLSPRVRGNRGRRCRRFSGLRSIPACTGEPSWASAASASLRVYPRVYGGTPSVSPSRRTV